MIGQMVMVMLGRVLNNWRLPMRFMRIGMYYIRFGVMIRAATGVGAP
jgi:hypothetical protein